jgi:predicted transport protein
LSGKTRADQKCDDAVRVWLDKLADFALALGDDVTEVVSSRSTVFHEPTWFIELVPRANDIEMRLACEATELASVAAGVQVTAQWAWIANSAVQGTQGSQFYINSSASLEPACALIRKTYELANDEA